MRVVEVQTCASAQPQYVIPIKSESDPKHWYNVVVPWPDDDSPEDLICECNGYTFRGRCKHQDLAFEKLCRWSEEDGPEEQSAYGKKHGFCPRCGEDTVRSLAVVD